MALLLTSNADEDKTSSASDLQTKLQPGAAIIHGQLIMAILVSRVVHRILRVQRLHEQP
jgi:hypothetical protein